MKDILLVFITLFTLTSCSLKSTTKTQICDCCNRTYSNIDSALNCILNNPAKQSSSDERLFLIAFVRKDKAEYQKSGWNILKDQDIIDAARQKYLLIVLNATEISNSKVQRTPELNEMISKHNEDIFFVITNQALYPFADWTNRENKNTIIDRLLVGNGP